VKRLNPGSDEAKASQVDIGLLGSKDKRLQRKVIFGLLKLMPKYIQSNLMSERSFGICRLLYKSNLVKLSKKKEE
jgi:hypothetical protein